MSIILPLFTIPLEILCIHFSNAFTSVRYMRGLRRPNAPFLLVISKNVFIYVSNNSLLFSLTCLLVPFSHSCSTSLSYSFFYFISLTIQYLLDCLANTHTHTFHSNAQTHTHRAFILYNIFRLHDESIHTWGITQKHDRMKVKTSGVMASDKVTPRIICIEMYTHSCICCVHCFRLWFSLKTPIHVCVYIGVCVCRTHRINRFIRV